MIDPPTPLIVRGDMEWSSKKSRRSVEMCVVAPVSRKKGLETDELVESEARLILQSTEAVASTDNKPSYSKTSAGLAGREANQAGETSADRPANSFTGGDDGFDIKTASPAELRI
jgi:hypothetical protein